MAELEGTRDTASLAGFLLGLASVMTVLTLGIDLLVNLVR